MTLRGLHAGRCRAGVTLLELLVVLVLLSAMGSVAALTVRPIRFGDEDRVLSIVSAARVRAVAEARPVTDSVRTSRGWAHLTALPGGGVVAAAPLSIDPLNGVFLKQREGGHAAR